MDILRFITAGNVDDGKSTLIGRLLYDTQNIKEDILDSVTTDDESAAINLAHLTDGLRSEREQGITIDVAYKYFTTPHRKYIVTDAPGHFQYTRNLVTGASAADLILILIDVRNGITEQTRRHSMVASFLQTQHVVVAVNKMDAVGYSAGIFNTIKEGYTTIARQLNLRNITYIPISALLGDNVFLPSQHMNWYTGPALMQYLESCRPIQVISNHVRCCIQYVFNDGSRPAYAAKMISGKLRQGDQVTINPTGHTAQVSRLMHGYAQVSEAAAGHNITVYLDGEVEVVRGNIISTYTGQPQRSNTFSASVCWLDSVHPLMAGNQYILRINAMDTTCIIMEVIHKTSVTTFEQYSDGSPLTVNELATIRIETEQAIAFDAYTDIPATGRGILVDPITNYTSGAFTIC